MAFIKATDELARIHKNEVVHLLRRCMKLSSICLSALLLLLTLTPGCVGGDEEADADIIPAFSVVADDEMTYSSENLLGTPYILHFSASWCSQCRPTIHAVDNHLSEHTYIIISTEASDASKLSDWHQQVNESKEDSTVDTPFSMNAELSSTLKISNTPTLILVDSDGVMIERHIGPMTDTAEIDDFWAQVS